MLVSHGGILRSFRLPDGWTEADIDREPLAAKSVRSFAAPGPGMARVRLVTWVRGLHPSVAARFRSGLAIPDHVLSDEEVDGLVPLVGHLADPTAFSREGGSFRHLNGRRVLVIQGTFKHGNVTALVVFVASGDDSQDIEELWCVCDAALLPQYESIFTDVIRSLTWIETDDTGGGDPEAVNPRNGSSALEQHFAEADRCLSSGDLAGAHDAYGRAIDTDPRCWPAYIGRARAFKQGGDFARAVDDYDFVLAQLTTPLPTSRTDPMEDLTDLTTFVPGVYAERGLIHFLMNRLDQAWNDLDAALELDPQHGPALCNRGMVRLRRDNDVDNAMADFDAALECDPLDASALFNRGYVYVATGRRERGMSDLEEAIGIRPELEAQVRDILAAHPE